MFKQLYERCEKYALHSTVQTTLAKAINGNNLKAVIVEAHPYALSGAPTASSTYQSVRTDISISTAETPGEVLYYVDTTVTNGQQKKIPKLKKLSVNDNIVCCQNLLLNRTVVDNHIFSATKIKLRKYKSCHEDASATGTSTDSNIVPFALDTLDNFCSVFIN